jgi:cell division protein FtsQ
METGTRNSERARRASGEPRARRASGEPSRSRLEVSIDPRIRRRRVEVLRDQGRRRLRLLAVVAGAGVLAVAGVAVVRSPLLAVRSVRVTGAHQTPVAKVIAASGLRGHPLMVDVDASSVARRLEALPWVAGAKVTPMWPSTVDVAISERETLGEMKLADGKWSLVDPSGRVLAIRSGPEPRLLYLDEPGPVGRPGSFLGPAAAPALLVARTLPSQLRAKVSTVATAGGDVDLSLIPRGTAVLGPPTELGQKFEALLTVLHEVDLARVKVVDVHVPEDPTLTRA